MKENLPFQSTVANLVFEWCKPSQKPPVLSRVTQTNFEEVFSFAARNGVAPWCYYQFKKHPAMVLPPELEEPLKMQYLQTLLMNRQKWKVFSEMNLLARQNGITIVPLKGTALAFTVYPQEALRPMGDIDILVPDAQMDLFADIMYQKGATPIHQPISQLHAKVNAHIPAIRWQNIMIEPHRRLFAIGSTLNPQQTDLFSETFCPQQIPNISIFNDVMQTYHLAGHLLKGYQLGGLRLGWLVDLALLLERNQHDPAFIRKVLNFNPREKEQMASVMAWAMRLLPYDPWNIRPKIPFPEETFFLRETDAAKRHKQMVVKEILRLPGIKNKSIMLFREFFPEKAYMDQQYGKHRGVALLKLYFKRILGF
ncbi:nucleotidyltransferase family protein [Thermophagus sp. OGC60D27]|uniref:nucleotidyltransferase family protein n=1 Tax=Thermophagus sp. OGC60D27 TaxID=3458415 RepID=UPI004037EC24